MRMLFGFMATILLASTYANADEMDRDVKGKSAQAPTVTKTAIAGSELDKESPEQSHHYRWRGGWGVSVGYGGYGGGWGASYYRPIGYGGGWGASYYRPIGYGGGWGSYYRPIGYGGWGGGWGSHYRCW